MASFIQWRKKNSSSLRQLMMSEPAQWRDLKKHCVEKWKKVSPNLKGTGRNILCEMKK